MQQKMTSSSERHWEEINGNSICLAKNVNFEAVKRKGIERMVPPAIVHGRAYGDKNSILVHCANIVPKDGRKNQALKWVIQRHN